jgi:biopolymer transport protein ExbB
VYERNRALDSEEMNVNIEVAFGAITNLGATWILWCLVLLSVAGLAIIVERAVCFWSTKDDIGRLSDEIGPLIAGAQWPKVEKLLSESPSFEARVAAAALGHEDPESADQLMLGASQTARLELERYLSFLGTVGSNAPFVGLLGTVIGIIGAFQQLDASRGAWTDGLMSEIGEALIATAVGLLVALPAIAAFNLFRSVVQTRLARADALRRCVLGQLHARRER